MLALALCVCGLAEVMVQLEKIMDSTNKNGTMIKRTLDDIKKDNAQYAEKEGVSAHTTNTQTTNTQRTLSTEAARGARRAQKDHEGKQTAGLRSIAAVALSNDQATRRQNAAISRACAAFLPGHGALTCDSRVPVDLYLWLCCVGE